MRKYIIAIMPSAYYVETIFINFKEYRTTFVRGLKITIKTNKVKHRLFTKTTELGIQRYRAAVIERAKKDLPLSCLWFFEGAVGPCV